MACRHLSTRRTMKPTERRLRVLEAAFSTKKPSKPVRQVIVDPALGETVEDVLVREGIGPDENVIVRMIMDPKPRAEWSNGAIDDSPVE